MYRLFLLFLPLLLYCAPLKIISLKEQNNAVVITFNEQIKQSDFSKHSISRGIYYDINAELTVKKRTFQIDNHYITIAQNTKIISRIVIEGKRTSALKFDINGKVLKLSFTKAKGASKESSKPKESESSSIADLFQSVNTDSKSSSAPDSSPDSSAISSAQDSNVSAVSPSVGKIIVIDPGHGGKDCGALASGVCEKTLTLNIAKLALEELKSRGYKVYLTRSSDKYVSLTDRTKFANDKNADIFISIHANALDKKSKNYASANGIETYFLSTARSERARKVAEIENKDDIEVMNYFSKLSFLNSLNSHRLLASNRLAIDVQGNLLLNTRKIRKDVPDGGVREGPFWVLAGALMPSILVEVGYMTNKKELALLGQKNYQQSIAQGIADGLDNYFLKNF